MWGVTSRVAVLAGLLCPLPCTRDHDFLCPLWMLLPPWVQVLVGTMWGAPGRFRVGARSVQWTHHCIWRNMKSGWTLVSSHAELTLVEREYLGVQWERSNQPELAENQWQNLSSKLYVKWAVFPHRLLSR